MRGVLRDGTWFTVDTKAQHDLLKRFGQITPPPVDFSSYRVQLGTWAGPGRYLQLSYTQRCPRNCCDDNVCDVLSAAEVVEVAREEMKELAAVLKEAVTAVSTNER